MAQSWRAMRLRDHFDTPSRHGVTTAWSPAGRNEGWRDYEKSIAPELREYNEHKKATRSESKESRRSRSRSSSRRHRRANSGSPSPDEGNELSGPGYPSPIEDSHAASWRLSYHVALSRRTRSLLKHQRPKHIGQLPVFSGMKTFTLKNMAITHLDGIGKHPEVTRIFLQQNLLTSFEGWEHQPSLIELNAADNLIESFKGLTASTTLERITLVGNPIAHCYHYRIMAIAACGKNLRMIDNAPVRKPEQEHALSLGKAVADAIRKGWILDNMANPDADIDLMVEQYIFYRKYGVLPDGARGSTPSNKTPRRLSVSRGQSDFDSDGSDDDMQSLSALQRSRPASRASAGKGQAFASSSGTPLKSTPSQSRWHEFGDSDDDTHHDRRKSSSRSISRSPGRLRNARGLSSDPLESMLSGRLVEQSDEAKQSKDRIKFLLEKLMDGGQPLDNELGSFLRSQGLVRDDVKRRDENDFDEVALAEAHRLRQVHAGAFFGWRNVQELMVKLNQDVNALDKRAERRRYVEELQPWRQKSEQGQRQKSEQGEGSEKTADTKRRSATPERESRVEKSVNSALRKSLFGTNGEPRTARSLKRAVLGQWAKVLDLDHEHAYQERHSTQTEEKVRIVLDLDFSEINKDLHGFMVALQRDLSGALGTENDIIHILNVEAGSVIVTVALLSSADGRSAGELVDDLKAQALDPKSALRSGIYTCSVKNLSPMTSTFLTDSHLKAVPIQDYTHPSRQPGTSVGVASPQSIASAAARAKEFESEREEIQRLAKAWQAQVSPSPEKVVSSSSTAVKDIEAEEAALLRQLAEVQQKKKICASSPQVTPNATPNKVDNRFEREHEADEAIKSADAESSKLDGLTIMGFTDIQKSNSLLHHDIERVTDQLTNMSSLSGADAAEAAMRSEIEREIEARMRRQQEEKERIDKDVQEKLRKEREEEERIERIVQDKLSQAREEKEREEKMKREIEDKVRREIEEKMKIEEDLKRKQEEEEHLKQRENERRMLEEEEERERRLLEQKREEDLKRKQEEEEHLKQRENERRMLEEEEERERRLLEQKREEDLKRKKEEDERLKQRENERRKLEEEEERERRLLEQKREEDLKRKKEEDERLKQRENERRKLEEEEERERRLLEQKRESEQLARKSEERERQESERMEKEEKKQARAHGEEGARSQAAEQQRSNKEEMESSAREAKCQDNQEVAHQDLSSDKISPSRVSDLRAKFEKSPVPTTSPEGVERSPRNSFQKSQAPARSTENRQVFTPSRVEDRDSPHTNRQSSDSAGLGNGAQAQKEEGLDFTNDNIRPGNHSVGPDLAPTADKCPLTASTTERSVAETEREREMEREYLRKEQERVLEALRLEQEKEREAELQRLTEAETERLAAEERNKGQKESHNKLEEERRESEEWAKQGRENEELKAEQARQERALQLENGAQRPQDEEEDRRGKELDKRPPTLTRASSDTVEEDPPSVRSNSPTDSTVSGGEKKKKKKKQDDVDSQGRPVLLKNCEIRGEPRQGAKLTAFAKRAKKIDISCTFQWYRLSQEFNASPDPIAGADKASYVISREDVGHLLRVVGLPIIKESNEQGQPVTATTASPVLPTEESGDFSERQDARMQDAADEDLLPRLTDWKIEMNPRQEYVDPIRMLYTYAGGIEGNTIVQWFREIETQEIGPNSEQYEEIKVQQSDCYQPYVDDINKRIKLQLTPVRNDGLHGPTYQHIISPLTIPHRLQEDVTRCIQEFKSRGANFLLAQVDLMDPNSPPRNLRIVCADKQLKVRNADTDKTELKVKIGVGSVSVQAHPDIQRLFTAIFRVNKAGNSSGDVVYHLLADSIRSRDIITLTLRAVCQLEEI